MPVWIQLARPKRISLQGVSKDYYPGDWVAVGKQMAQAWIAAGDAVVPFPQAMTAEEPAGTAGVMVFNGQASYEADVGVPFLWGKDAKRELLWEKTIWWDMAAPVQRHFFAIGFKFLDKWQVACPLWDYRELASGEGTEAERERTRAVIRELRVPMYDTRLLFMRRCHETRTLVELWDAESNGQLDKLSFLRALYQVKPLTLALPVTWTAQWAPSEA